MITKDRSFYKTFFMMFIVLVLQNVITISVNLADNIMLGAYDETALSGAAAVNQIQFVYQQILMSIGEGAVIIGTQYFGKGMTDPIKKLSSASMRFGLLVAVILFVLVSFFPSHAVAIFTNDAAIIEAGAEYLSIIRFTYIFFAMTQILLAALRCVGTVNIALWLSVSTLIINGCINYTLIYGHFGAPEMGIRGAAIGTLVARIVEFITVVIYIAFSEKKITIRFRDYLHTDKTLTKDYIKVMLPVLFTGSLWGFNNAAQNVILGHLTSIAIAANSVASTLFLLVKSAAQGAASTSAYIIGRTVGEGDIGKVKQYSRTLQIMFIAIGLVCGVILFFLRIPILSLYNLKPETKEMANQFLLILSVIVVTMSYQMPTNFGIVRAGGDTRYTMLLDLISIWGVCIPFAFILAFFVHAPATAVVWMLNADQIFKCVPAFIKSNFGHWIKKLTREQ